MPDNPRYTNGTYDKTDADWQNAFGETDGRPAHLLRQDALTEMDKPKSSPAYNSMKLDFTYLDLDSNGFLDSSEIAEGAKTDVGLQKLNGDRQAQFDIKRMVNDGKDDARGISMNDVDEFGRRVTARDHANNDPADLKMGAEFLQKYFGKINRKGDGYLSKDELGQLIVDPNLKPDFRNKFLLMERHFDAVSELHQSKILKSKEHIGLTRNDLQQLVANQGRINLSNRRK